MKQHMAFLDKIIYSGGFLTAFGAYLLFIKEPAANEQQRIFRIAIFGAGIVIALLGIVLKAILGKSRAA